MNDPLCPIFRIKDMVESAGQNFSLVARKYFKIIINNQVHSSTYRSNMISSKNFNRLQSCRYDKMNDPLCPIFRIKDMVESAGQNFSLVARKGAVIEVRIIWNCDLDLNFMKSCLPEYSFHRLDYVNYNVTFGWNFRHSFHNEHGRRMSQEFYGIKFVIQAHGEGCKTAVIPILSNLGFGCGFFVIVSKCNGISSA
ncbi:hypothetical protein J437_LFUL007631 [Ladona fulva]|uniref:Uncharacterized protein n=1 Tax=Ladona fulva TaxID=123851 RepID=A0A8K0K5Q4_LADFU|nr:hypothetical protein J437_LFUL007631 [Ladona fulva]